MVFIRAIVILFFAIVCERTGLSQNGATVGDGPLAVTVVPGVKTIRAYDGLHLIVQVVNSSDQPFAFPGPPPTQSGGGVHLQWRPVGGEWKELQLCGHGLSQSNGPPPPRLEPNRSYVVRALILCDRQHNSTWSGAERGELRAIVRVDESDNDSPRFASPAVPLVVMEPPRADRRLISDRMGEIYDLFVAESEGWKRPPHGYPKIVSILDIESELGPCAVRDTIQRTKLYGKLFPPKDASAELLATADDAVKQLEKLSENATPAVRRMIRVNLALYHYRKRNFDAGDRILKEFGPLDSDAWKLRAMRNESAAGR